MKRFRLPAALLMIATLCLSLLAASAQSALTFKVYPSSAPNRHGSGVSLTAYATWTSRALQSVEGNKASIGDWNSDPGAFIIINNTTPRDWLVSANKSWHGKADPTGAFANQQGNRLHFVLHVMGDGTVTFKMEDVRWNFYSNGNWWTPPAPTPAPKGRSLKKTSPPSGYNAAQQFADCTYGWGYDWGADNTKGGTDDTKVCGDESKHQQAVDEIFVVVPAYGHAVDNRYQDPNSPSTVNWTVQEWIYAHCSFFNSGTDFKQIGLNFSIDASDGNTYTHLAALTNLEHGLSLNPDNCQPLGQYKPKKTAVPASSATPAPTATQVHTAEELQSQGYQVSATFGLQSGIQMRQVGTDAIGNQSIIDAGFIDAVDIWGYADQGAEVCIPTNGATGVLIFVDSNTTPHTVTPMESTLRDGYICGSISGAGTVVFVQSWAGAPEPAQATDATDLENCMVATTAVLNFRDGPDGNIIGTVPYNASLTATARTDGWFQVDNNGVTGWISADYVTTRGTCD